LYVFDAAGSTGCSGAPKTCAPLWTATTGGHITSSPAVSGELYHLPQGSVFLGSLDGELYSFDARGTVRCSGTPQVCTPLWVATLGGPVESSPAVADDLVYVGSRDHQLHVFTATCFQHGGSGGTAACPDFAGNTFGEVYSSPAVNNGVVYVGSADHVLY